MPSKTSAESRARGDSNSVELHDLETSDSNLTCNPTSPHIHRTTSANVAFSPMLNEPPFPKSSSVSTRRRRMSRSSISSGVASVRSRTSRASRRSDLCRSVLDEAGSEESIGDIDDDVCFPSTASNEDANSINVSELDKLLLGNTAPNPPRFSTDTVHHGGNNPAHAATSPVFKNNEAVPTLIVENPSSSGGDTATLSSSDEQRSPMGLSFMDPTKGNNIGGLELPDAYDPLPIMGRSPHYGDENHVPNNKDCRFNFFATDMKSTIHSATLEGLLEPGLSFTSLFKEEGAVWWLDCANPTDQELKILTRAFGIHPLTSEDIRFEETREKFELFKNYYFVCFHTFEDDPENRDEYLEPVPFYMIVYPRGLLTFHPSNADVSHPRNVRRRIRQLRDYVDVSADWICYALIDDITDSFAPILHDIENEADFIEEHVYVQNAEYHNMSSILDRLSEARKKTMRVMRLLTGKADVLRGFGKRCSKQWSNMPSTDIELYLCDISDHLVTMHQNLAAYEQIFGRSHFNFMSQLQMEFVDSNNRMTTVLGKATVIGTILVPMNLITGLFGMNVKVPGQDGSNLGWFFGILGFVILLIVSLATVANLWVTRITKTV